MRLKIFDTPVSYPQMWELQQAQALRCAEGAEDQVYLLEHLAVVTRGRGLQRQGAIEAPRQMPLDPASLPVGTEYCEVDRGGDLTWHGPGQLVIYPIVNLDREESRIWDLPRRDLGGYLRTFEERVIQALTRLGLPAVARPGSSGVWLQMGEGKQGLRKIASIGVSVKNWVTQHGMAINLDNDWSGFAAINPCGFSAEVMINLRDALAAQGLGAPWVGSGLSLREWFTLELCRYLFPESAQETVCYCYRVNREEIRRSIALGARTVARVRADTCACSGCGGCEGDVERLLEERIVGM